MHIGKLARKAGTTTRTVRYYEEMGLIQPECRSPGGFRCYSDDQLSRLRMILSLKEMEFELEHIKSILDKQFENNTGGQLATAVLKDLNHRLAEVDSQIAHYQKIRKRLGDAINSICCCEPCQRRLDERICSACEVLHVEPHVPFFHISEAESAEELITKKVTV